MSTTVVENKETARRFLEEAFGDENHGLFDELVAEEFVARNNAASEPIRGPEGLKELASMNRAAFPDLDIMVEEIIAEGDKVVLKFRVMGTHEGEFMGIDPTGNTIDIRAMNILRFEDGRIVEGFGRLDPMGMMVQLGVIDPPWN